MTDYSNYDFNDYDFDKDLDIKVDVDLDFDTDIKLDKDVDIDIKVDSYVDLEGNFASATFSTEAIGTDTIAEADVHVLVIESDYYTDGLSSVDGSLIAAAG